MKRRRFLQSSGFIGAAPLAAAQAPAARQPVLITSAASRLAQALAGSLKEQYPIRLTERSAVKTGHEFVECALGHDEATDALVRGVRAIVHVAEPLPGDSPQQQVDLLTRCTYNLLTAAAAAEVRPQSDRERNMAAPAIGGAASSGEAPGRVNLPRIRS
jgi:hypothetical protein